jgi:CRP-like cAMP-binding protein
LAHGILRLAAQIGKAVAGGTLIDLTLSRQDIAEMTGTTIYTVSRTLSKWEGEGIIESGRERVLVRKPDALKAIADD